MASYMYTYLCVTVHEGEEVRGHSHGTLQHIVGVFGERQRLKIC